VASHYGKCHCWSGNHSYSIVHSRRVATISSYLSFRTRVPYCDNSSVLFTNRDHESYGDTIQNTDKWANPYYYFWWANSYAKFGSHPYPDSI
jgi:hypothetical protein